MHFRAHISELFIHVPTDHWYLNVACLNMKQGRLKQSDIGTIFTLLYHLVYFCVMIFHVRKLTQTIFNSFDKSHLCQTLHWSCSYKVPTSHPRLLLNKIYLRDLYINVQKHLVLPQILAFFPQIHHYRDYFRDYYN